MTSHDFPEFATKQANGAIASRKKLSGEQLNQLEELIGELTGDPATFEALSQRTETGQLVYRQPSSGLEVTFSVDMTQKTIYFFHFSAPLPPRHTIFISYSHVDVEWMNMLRKFLKVLEQQGIIRCWADTEIKSGDRWHEAIRQALDSSCAAVLLVSQDFLTSKFIVNYELPRLLADAKREGKKIFWIPVTPSTVFESNHELTVFESLIEDPRTSLFELPPPQQLRTLVDASARLRAALS
jgi:hypothetical protein